MRNCSTTNFRISLFSKIQIKYYIVSINCISSSMRRQSRSIYLYTYTILLVQYLTFINSPIRNSTRTCTKQRSRVSRARTSPIIIVTTRQTRWTWIDGARGDQHNAGCQRPGQPSRLMHSIDNNNTTNQYTNNNNKHPTNKPCIGKSLGIMRRRRQLTGLRFVSSSSVQLKMRCRS